MLTPEKRETDLGRALVQQAFKISRVGVVAGCRVLSGVVQRGARARVIRDNTIIGEYPVEALKRIKDDVKEVREGLECGIKLAGFSDIKTGDILDVFKIEEVARSL
jgi:translation initiation factor IF-2